MRPIRLWLVALPVLAVVSVAACSSSHTERVVYVPQATAPAVIVPTAAAPAVVVPTRYTYYTYYPYDRDPYHPAYSSY